MQEPITTTCPFCGAPVAARLTVGNPEDPYRERLSCPRTARRPRDVQEPQLPKPRSNGKRGRKGALPELSVSAFALSIDAAFTGGI